MNKGEMMNTQAILHDGRKVLLSDIPAHKYPIGWQHAWLCDIDHDVIYPNEMITICDTDINQRIYN